VRLKVDELKAVLQAFRDGWRITGLQHDVGRPYWVLSNGASAMQLQRLVPKRWVSPRGWKTR